ncbi:hypothetical protein, partial [Clostridioides difficile]|uniref:hypothetical protein n=1 Tax=Clostridioides difficile TaxID=1496 RepID=UPI000BCF36E3
TNENKEEGRVKFGRDGMAERKERARKGAGKDNHIKALEDRISLLERFSSLPQVKRLWEQFQGLIGRKKPQKDHERKFREAKKKILRTAENREKL